MTYINKGKDLVKADQLFVYGIFLGEKMRARYNMTDAHYDTVPDFVTFGDFIVQAVPVDKGIGVQLTGLVVDIDPAEWKEVDALKAGYERIVVETSTHGAAYMYAAKGTLAELEKEEKDDVGSKDTAHN